MSGSRQELAELVGRIYGLHAPLESVMVFGRRQDSEAWLYLADGTKIEVAALRDLLRPEALTVTVGACTAGRSRPVRNRVHLYDAYSAVLQLAELIEAEDKQAEVEEWIDRVWRVAGGVFEEFDMSPGADRLRAIRWMRRHDCPIVRDTATGDCMISATALLREVRLLLGAQISPERLRVRMLQAGFEHRKVEQWPPGASRKDPRTKKAKIPVYVIEALRARTQEGDTGDRGTEPDPEPGPAPPGKCPKCDAPWQPPDADGDVSCPNGHWHPEEGAS